MTKWPAFRWNAGAGQSERLNGRFCAPVEILLDRSEDLKKESEVVLLAQEVSSIGTRKFLVENCNWQTAVPVLFGYQNRLRTAGSAAQRLIAENPEAIAEAEGEK